MVPGYVLNLDVPRMNRVVERTVRGLQYRHLGRTVPWNHQLSIALEPAHAHELTAEVADYLRKLPKVTIANGEFAYQWKQLMKSNSDQTAWLLTFYGVVEFLVMVTPVDSPQKFWLTVMEDDDNDPRVRAAKLQAERRRSRRTS